MALVHDWLIHMRGGEKVLEALLEVFPQADVFTLFYKRESLSPVLKNARIRASFLQNLPGVTRYYRWLLPLMPLAVRGLSLKDYDVVISSSHCVAKGCRIPPEALHVCYCHTPVRYVWGFREEYFGSYPLIVRKITAWFLDLFKQWDINTNSKVHFFIANSENTAGRIKKFYNRDALVIYPPVDTSSFSTQRAEISSGEQRGKAADQSYFLVVSALVPYKRIDLAVRAFNQLGDSLHVVGDGPERKKLEAMAAPNVHFFGNVGGQELRRQYAGCRALIFPGEEDFGIVPVEAQACGRPVIAFAKGGALESVSGDTGVFFNEQTIESLVQAVRRFESLTFHTEVIKERACRFDRKVFKQKVTELVPALYETWKKRKGVDNSSVLATK